MPDHHEPEQMKRSSTSSTSSNSSDASDSADVANMYLAALRGQELPDAASLQSAHGRRATIHGIRHHLAFAQRPAVVALCQQPAHAALARARHARLIMSDIVPPAMGAADDDAAVLPYCIWHPDIATEATYRAVAAAYPRIRYNVARACAVAGYAALYAELGVVPDVAVAEEAQASERGGEIFAHIMAQPVRYAVMNDYENRIAETPRPGACLNGDTAVASVLRLRSENPDNVPDAWPSYWDIEEDGYIGEADVGHLGEDYYGTVTERELDLLERPLPANLPTVNKDVLILMAAYEGNMDRYARLARPNLLQGEEACITRGIYHNTCFAKWWAARNLFPAAVNARRTMVNDLSYLVPGVAAEDLPYLIWYPLRPDVNTLFEIVRREPRMWVAVAHACIACSYTRLFDLLLPRITPTRELLWEAEQACNPHFKKLLALFQEQGRLVRGRGEAAAEVDKAPTETLVSGRLWLDSLWEKHHPKLYAGRRANAAALELYLMVPGRIRDEAAASEVGNYALYQADDGVEREWDESIFDESALRSDRC